MTTSVASVRAADQSEDLIRTLPGVVSVRVVDDQDGSIKEVHILTTSEISAKQTVRNVESALLAHLGIRIDHRRVSVAAATESPPPAVPQPAAVAPAAAEPSQQPPKASVPPNVTSREGKRRFERGNTDSAGLYSPVAMGDWPRRKIYFEDVEIRGSRAHGLACRVTLIKEGASFVGEARGVDGDRARPELAARAACLAISDADGRDRQFGCEGVRMFDAFERRFVFVGVILRAGRDNRLLTGSCEVTDSLETAAVLAVLDATNRWLDFGV